MVKVFELDLNWVHYVLDVAILLETLLSFLKVLFFLAEQVDRTALVLE